jgi:hypothetical protein
MCIFLLVISLICFMYYSYMEYLDCMDKAEKDNVKQYWLKKKSKNYQDEIEPKIILPALDIYRKDI